MENSHQFQGNSGKLKAISYKINSNSSHFRHSSTDNFENNENSNEKRIRNLIEDMKGVCDQLYRIYVQLGRLDKAFTAVYMKYQLKQMKRGFPPWLRA